MSLLLRAIQDAAKIGIKVSFDAERWAGGPPLIMYVGSDGGSCHVDAYSGSPEEFLASVIWKEIGRREERRIEEERAAVEE